MTSYEPTTPVDAPPAAPEAPAPAPTTPVDAPPAPEAPAPAPAAPEQDSAPKATHSVGQVVTHETVDRATGLDVVRHLLVVGVEPADEHRPERSFVVALPTPTLVDSSELSAAD